MQQDDLQSLLILFKNSDLTKEDGTKKVFEKVFPDKEVSTQTLLDSLKENGGTIELEAVLLHLTRNCKDEAALILKEVIPLITREDVDGEFQVDILDALISYQDFYGPESPLTISFKEILMTLGNFIAADTTGLSQKSIQVMKTYVTQLDKYQNTLIDNGKEELSGLLIQQLNSSKDAKEMIVYVRFFEVAVEIALQSDNLCQKIAKVVIGEVFKDFFSFDILTQVTIMDFVVKLSENEFGVKVMNESNFMTTLFGTFGGAQGEDSFGFVTSNMLLVGAKLYSTDPTTFNPFENANYMYMFKAYLCSNDPEKPHLKDIGLSCLYFMLLQKDHCLVKYLIEDATNHDILNHLLRVSKTTNQDQRKAWLIAMRQLLKKQLDVEIEQRMSDITQLTVSNVTTPANFPNNFGQIDDAITFLVQIASTPYGNEEILCLRLFKQLIKHKWGCKAFFQNQAAIKYSLERRPQAEKEVAEKKYSFINQIVKESQFIMDATLVDAVIATQLQTYHSNGIYGTHGSANFLQEIPEMATM